MPLATSIARGAGRTCGAGIVTPIVTEEATAFDTYNPEVPSLILTLALFVTNRDLIRAIAAFIKP